MPIQIDPGDWVLGLWVFDNPPYNMLGIARKHEDKWLFDCRSRYYIDDEVWDSADPKAFWKINFDPTIGEAGVLEMIRGLFKHLADTFGDGKYVETLIRSSDSHALHQAMLRTPHMHIKVLEVRDVKG